MFNFNLVAQNYKLQLVIVTDTAYPVKRNLFALLFSFILVLII